VQEMRIELKRTITKEENEAIKKAKAAGKGYHPAVFENGDTKKQLIQSCHVVWLEPCIACDPVFPENYQRELHRTEWDKIALKDVQQEIGEKA